MKRMIEVPLESGGSMFMEVELDEAEQEGMVPAARPGELAVRAKMTFEQALDQVKPVADAVITRLRAMSSQPDEVTVTFGLKMSAEAGAIIASTSVEANFSVVLKWGRS